VSAPRAGEDACLRCGRCCYAKVVIGDDVFYTDIPCLYLDVSTRLCRVYEHRFEVNPDCLTVEKGIAGRAFPADCPYVAGIQDYRPPRADGDPREMGRLYESSE